MRLDLVTFCVHPKTGSSEGVLVERSSRFDSSWREGRLVASSMDKPIFAEHCVNGSVKLVSYGEWSLVESRGGVSECISGGSVFSDGGCAGGFREQSVSVLGC